MFDNISSRKILAIAMLLGIAFAIFWIVTMPKTVPDSPVFATAGDPINGEEIFNVGGCASCHSPEGAEAEDKLVLAGGRLFPSPFGTFIAPNISPDPEFGIGDWSAHDLANAMMHGTSPEGKHYFPAFPYISYARMNAEDIVDLKAFLDTLPLSDTPTQDHDIPAIFKWRRVMGGWKLLFFDPAPVLAVSSEVERGRYLVEGLGHCSECHTPRNPVGGLVKDLWMSGAPDPEGKGFVPNITQHEDGIASWTQTDIAYYLSTGFTPEFDSAGGLMAEVIDNTALLSDDDRNAIAAYLKAVPPLPTRK